MEENRREKLISRLKKCLALSASPEPHEAAAALRQAQKLMRELDLTEADLLGLELADALVMRVGDARGARAGVDEVAIPDAPCLVGYAFDADLVTCRLDSSASEGMIKTGSKVQFRVYESGSFNLYHGMAMGTSELVNVPIPLDSGGNVAYPYSGLLAVENPAGEATDQTIRVKSSDGQPVNILVIAPGYEVGGVA